MTSSTSELDTVGLRFSGEFDHVRANNTCNIYNPDNTAAWIKSDLYMSRSDWR